MKPKNILTVAEAKKLIDSDTPENPTVDNVQLIKGTEYLLTNWRSGNDGMNYTIWTVARKDGKIVQTGKKWVHVASVRERDELLYAITDHYKARSGREVDPAKLGLSQISTTLERDTAGASTGKARKNASGTKLKLGDELGSGTKTVEEY